MKKTIFAVMLLLLATVMLGGYALSKSVYWAEVLVGLTVACLFGLVGVGMVIGAWWTGAAMRAGARLAEPGQRVVEAEMGIKAQGLRLVENVLQVVGRNQPALPPGHQPAAEVWLPPLVEFEREEVGD